MTGAPVPQIIDDDWSEDAESASALLHSVDGSQTGIHLLLDQVPEEPVARVADQVHEWVIEELWTSAPTNWPPCPHHPTTHPLEVALRDGGCWWVCPSDGTPFSRLGELPA